MSADWVSVTCTVNEKLPPKWALPLRTPPSKAEAIEGVIE